MTRDLSNNSRKITMYQCPSPGCRYVSGDAEAMSEHVNEEHPGEWDEGYWPDPEEDDE